MTSVITAKERLVERSAMRAILTGAAALLTAATIGVGVATASNHDRTVYGFDGLEYALVGSEIEYTTVTAIPDGHEFVESRDGPVKYNGVRGAFILR